MANLDPAELEHGVRGYSIFLTVAFEILELGHYGGTAYPLLVGDLFGSALLIPLTLGKNVSVMACQLRRIHTTKP
jgi:hypothetical protein